MRTHIRMFVSILSAVTFASTAAAAQGKREPILIDRFGSITCDDFRSRIDTMLSELARNPSSRAVVINRGEKRVQLIREEAIRGQVQYRNFDEPRIDYVRTVARGDYSTEFWRVSVGDPVPIAAGEIDNGYAMNIEKSEMLLEESEEGEVACPEPDHRKLFGLILEANPHARGNIVVRRETRQQSLRAGSRLLSYLVSKHRISRKRLRLFVAKPAPYRSIEYWYLP